MKKMLALRRALRNYFVFVCLAISIDQLVDQNHVAFWFHFWDFWFLQPSHARASLNHCAQLSPPETLQTSRQQCIYGNRNRKSGPPFYREALVYVSREKKNTGKFIRDKKKAHCLAKYNANKINDFPCYSELVFSYPVKMFCGEYTI